MTNHDNASLENTINAVTEKIRKFKGRAIGEQNTKASLIDPILEALGWDIRDPDEVHREFKPVPRDSPVDYALKIIRKPRLFVEAKGLDENLSDRQWIAQVLGYAVVAGVEWCVLSDGDEFRFYNANAPLDADEKLFCSMRLSETAAPTAANTLRLISRTNMEENLLDVLWAAHYVDRQVRETLRTLIDSPDKRMVRLIRSVLPKLTTREIADSIRRLDIRISPPPDLPDAARTPPGRPVTSADSQSSTQSAPKPKPHARHARIGVSLAEIIGAGLLKPPTKLFRKYKGKKLEATLALDGSVEFQGTPHSTASAAANFARKSVTGGDKATNGWAFWQYVDANGKTATLDQLRSQFLARR